MSPLPRQVSTRGRFFLFRRPPRPGRKTDTKNCEWIAGLLQHGLLKGSFVPPAPIRELRDLNRNRAILAQQRATVSNRIEKVLEGHHRFQWAQLLEQWHSPDAQIARFGQEIEERSQPFSDLVERLTAIPGLDKITASALVAEMGVDMKQFPTAQHLASWAGMCPGNHESAGKNYSGKTRKCSRWLPRVLCQAARAASHTHNTYLAALFRRIASRRGKNRAIIAVAHSILTAVY